jgi:hypothetical protein
MSVTNFPSPPCIPISGANDDDIQATCRHVELLNKLFQSIVLDMSTIYRNAMLAAIANHNENISAGPKARPTSFEYGLDDVLADFLRSMNNVTFDVVGNISAAMQE